MQNLSKSVCARFREARRELGLGQVALAEEVGCKQPALSAFEQGNPTKLSEETVLKLAKRLGVSLEEPVVEPPVGEFAAQAPQASAFGFCPVHDCPSNTFYTVSGRGYYRVTLQAGKYCAHCGEVLEHVCPHCGAPLNNGACCTACGKPYVA